MNKLIEMFFNKTALVVYGICIGCGIVYGAIRAPFYLHFLDGMTISGFLFLALAIVRYSWISGDFTFFSWGVKKRKIKGMDVYDHDPSRGMSYTEYRKHVREERKDIKNPYMASSILILIVSLILSLLY